MFEKDKLSILSMLDAADKIFEYTKVYSAADEFYNSQRDFDAAMWIFSTLNRTKKHLARDMRSYTIPEDVEDIFRILAGITEKEQR